MKALTAEQLQAGDAIDLINQKFAGFAATGAVSFTGVSQQIVNIWGDMRESFGATVTENPAVLGALDQLKVELHALSIVIGDAEDGMQDFVTKGLLFFLEAMKRIVTVTGFVKSSLNSLRAVFSFSWGVVISGAAKVVEAQKFVAEAFVKLVNLTRREGNKISNPYDKSAETLGRMGAALLDSANDFATTALENRNSAQGIQDAIDRMVDSAEIGRDVMQDFGDNPGFAKAKEAAGNAEETMAQMVARMDDAFEKSKEFRAQGIVPLAQSMEKEAVGAADKYLEALAKMVQKGGEVDDSMLVIVERIEGVKDAITKANEKTAQKAKQAAKETETVWTKAFGSI